MNVGRRRVTPDTRRRATGFSDFSSLAASSASGMIFGDAFFQVGELFGDGLNLASGHSMIVGSLDYNFGRLILR